MHGHGVCGFSHYTTDYKKARIALEFTQLILLSSIETNFEL